MSDISITSELYLEDLRKCYETAKTNPNDDFFKQEPGALEICKKGAEGVLLLLFDDFKEESCDNPNLILNESKFTIDGKDTVLNGAKELQKFLQDNHKTIYYNAISVKIHSHFVERSQDPTEEEISIYNEYEEFIGFLTTIYGECEPTHEEL